MILADQHLHSIFSGDSETPMELQIEKAISLGLKSMCFTEHMDIDFPLTDGENPFELDTDAYMEKITECREKYEKQIQINFGVEFGFQKHLVARNKEYIEKYPFDFVIGSQHLLQGMDVYYPDIYRGSEEKEVYRQYFEEMLISVRCFEEFDVLGHLDYVVRYGPNKNKFYKYADYSDIIDEILKVIIDKKCGIELNTGGFRKLKNEPNPCYDVLKRYREMGGEIITIGSDAHVPEDIASEFARAKDFLCDAGFKNYAVYTKRKPQFFTLDG